MPATRKGYRRLRYWADLHDGRGYARHSKTIRGTYRDGQRELARLQVKYGDDHPCPTVGEVWDLWVYPDMIKMHEAYLADPSPSERGKRDKMKTSTLNQHRSTWKVHVAPRWENVPISGVRYSDIQQWLDTKTEKPASRSLVMLRLILRYCVRNGEIERNVADDDFRMPTAGIKRDDHGKWTMDELNEKMWKAVWGKPCEAAFILSAFDGARTGECLAPKVVEVETITANGMTFAVVPFNRQVDNDGHVSAESDLKNKWSPRVTVLPPPWSHRLLQLRDEAMERGEIWLSDRGDHIPMSQRMMRRDFFRCIAQTDVEKRDFRALRRSWRSWISNKGISSEILEKMMGHSSGSTTSRFYLKADAELIVEEMARAYDWNKIQVSWDILGHK